MRKWLWGVYTADHKCLTVWFYKWQAIDSMAFNDAAAYVKPAV